MIASASSEPRIVSAGEAPLEVLILAPTGKDAQVAIEVLEQAKISARAMGSIPELCAQLSSPVGTILIAEEALEPDSTEILKSTLSLQEPWSNLPLLLLTSARERVFKTEAILEVFGVGGAVSVLERPFRITTLLASVRVALQARERQYQVRDLLREQISAVKQRDEFFSIASHELRTPLTSLKLQVQMRKRLLKAGDRSICTLEKTESLLETTEDQVNRISRLIDDMLDITRLANGKLTLSPEPVDLSSLVEKGVQTFQPQFQFIGSRIGLEMEGHVTGRWDPYRIEQVIANLLTNALKYGAGKPVFVQVRVRDDKAVLTVKDGGIGVSPENQERIFQRFERAASASNPSGLGLGLYITRQILELHGGSIRVDSKLGEGSTFTVELPREVERLNDANG